MNSPSPTDQRRLCDGARALDISTRPAGTVAEVREQIEVVHAGLAAMQSLDDLGPEANARAYHDEQELWIRLKALEAQLAQLEAKESPCR